MAPSLGKAYNRRWWIACTAILENLTFAAVLLGWSSLLLMLKNEGFYAYQCYNENETVPEKHEVTPFNGTNDSFTNLTNLTSLTSNLTSNGTMGNETEKIRYTPSGYRTCRQQDETLNRYFSIGSSILSAVTVVLGFFMDKYGSRAIRLAGSVTFAISCFLIAIASKNPNELSILMAPAICMNGAGGITYIFTSFPIPNFFEHLRSTMIALMIGSYSASALIYMVFKALYDSGVSFQALMYMHGALALLTFVNAFVNQPGVPIPAPGDLSYAISMKEKKKAARYDQRAIPETSENETSDSVGRRLSGADNAENENTSAPGNSNATREEDQNETPNQTFWQVLTTPIYWCSVATMCLTQIRLISYMGWLEAYLKSSAERQGYNYAETYELVNSYTQLFGILQLNCFLMAPVIGLIMDWNLKPKTVDDNAAAFSVAQNEIQLKPANGTQQDVNGNATSNGARPNIKKQQIINLSRAFFITNFMLTLFGIIVLIDNNLPLQILAFILHTVIRTFLHSSTGGLYAAMYHFSLFGKLTGVTSFLGAIFILIQDPMFINVQQQFGGNPYWHNFGMLMFTATGFLLPFLLWREARKLSDYEPVPTEDDRFQIGDDADTENLVASARSIGGPHASDDDITVSKGALVF